MRANRRKHVFRRSVRRILTLALLAGACGVAAIWLAVSYKPGWYHPPVLDKAGMRLARRDAVATADSVSDQMVQGLPFETVLSDQAVNTWLAALPETWPEAREAMPSQIRRPAIGFDDGEVHIGAHYSEDGWQAVISAGVSISVSEDGNDIEIALTGVSGGAIPIPRAILKRLLEQFLHDLQDGQNSVLEGTAPRQRSPRPQNGMLHTPPLAEAGDRRNGQYAGSESALVTTLGEIGSVDELLEGVKIRNRFIWFNGDRPFRIDSIEIDAGKLRLYIEPL